MTNTLKHLALLARMESSGLKLGLTGKFPEDAPVSYTHLALVPKGTDQRQGSGVYRRPNEPGADQKLSGAAKRVF